MDSVFFNTPCIKTKTFAVGKWHPNSKYHKMCDNIMHADSRVARERAFSEGVSMYVSIVSLVSLKLIRKITLSVHENVF